MSCPDCFKGFVRPGDPAGRKETVHGRDTYVAEPTGTPKGVVVIIPDAFGWEFKNNQILADEYASMGGYKVYLPDFMDNSAAPIWMIGTMAAITKPSTSRTWKDVLMMPYNIARTVYAIVPFLRKNSFAKANPRIQSFLEAIRADPSEGSLPLGVAGFCWGGLFAFKFAANKKNNPSKNNESPLIDASFTAHPSNLSIPDDFENVVLPSSMAIGDQDIQINMKNVEKVQKIWSTKSDTEIKVYPQAGHGFSVRADPNNEKQSQQSDEARDQAIAFFQKYLV